MMSLVRYLQLQLLLLTILFVTSLAQPGRGGGGGGGYQKPPLQPLGDVLLLVLDANKDQSVDMREVQQQLATLALLFQEDETGEYSKLLQPIQQAAPQLFRLLDVNGDGKLTKAEMQWVTKLEKSLPAKANPSFKNFVRECFELIDSDGDNELTRTEWNDKTQHLATIVAKFHQLFPIRQTAQELEDILGELLLGHSADSQKEASQKVFDWLDADKNGVVSRAEVGQAYNAAGKKWMEISKQIKEFGPMMALLGGMGGGGNGMKMEF